MKFCPECDAFCMTDTTMQRYFCSKCGWTETLEEIRIISRNSNKKSDDKIIVVGKKERKISTLPKTKIKCPKCDNNEAFWWMIQTRGTDEPTTQFLRCTKCNNTWRENS
jgi:DNA-directed RNA polymerase subunit M